MAELLGQPALPVATLAELATGAAMPEVGAALAAAFAAALGMGGHGALGRRSATRGRALRAEIGTEAFVEGEAAA